MSGKTFKEIVKSAEESLQSVKYIVPILSGKGGVGKSFIACLLAIGLNSKNRRVVILDADLHGPSVPWILGIKDLRLEVTDDGKLIPIEVKPNLRVISLELLLDDKTAPTIWRGPLKTKALIELITKSKWDSQDYLVIDLPPGTGDEPLTIMQLLQNKIVGAILVATPGAMVLHIVRKAKKFLETLGVRLLGIVLNMAYYRCPKCGHIVRLFGEVQQNLETQILAEIPLLEDIAFSIENSMLLQEIERNSLLRELALNLAERVIDIIEH